MNKMPVSKEQDLSVSVGKISTTSGELKLRLMVGNHDVRYPRKMAIIRTVLTHGRDHEAIDQGYIANGERVEECWDFVRLILQLEGRTGWYVLRRHCGSV